MIWIYISNLKLGYEFIISNPKQAQASPSKPKQAQANPNKPKISKFYL